MANTKLEQSWVSREGHDFCSPSKLSLRADCPGSARLERDTEQADLGFSTPNLAADRGKELHADTMDVLTGKSILEALTHEIEDMEQLRCVLDQSREIIDRFRDTEVVVQYEFQTDLSELGISGGVHGCRIDMFILVLSMGSVVVDWKYGRIWVPRVEWNYQIQAYSWGVWKKFGGNVEGIILQPQSPDGRNYMQCVFDDEAFKKIEDTIGNIVHNCKKPDAPLVRGPHCEKKFCSLRHSTCPLWKGSLLEIPDGKNFGSYFLTLCPEDRGEMLNRIKAISHVSESCFGLAQEIAIKTGLQIAGWEVGPGKSKYICPDKEKFKTTMAPFVERKGVAVEQLMKPAQEEEPKSKSDVTKIVGNSKQIQEAIKSLYVEVLGDPILKRSKE
jgi:hypothetical protein